MLFDFAQLEGTNAYKLLTSTVVPRPIAWVVSQDEAGGLNAAPFSFFNVMSGDPAFVCLGIGVRDGTGVAKDSRANIVRTRQFVINLVSEDLAQAMNVTAIDFPKGTDELGMAGLKTEPSARVKPPRIAGSPVALECELFQTVEIGPEKAILVARVLAMHVDDDKVLDPRRCHIDTPALKLIGRMHGGDGYVRTNDRFQLDRIPLSQWQVRP